MKQDKKNVGHSIFQRLLTQLHQFGFIVFLGISSGGMVVNGS